MKRKINQLLSLLAFVFLLSTVNAQQSYNLSSELNSLGSLKNLPKYREQTKNLQVSSYDRTGGNDDGFGGTYSYLRRNTDSSLVIFDSKGKGIIDRIWTPTPINDTLDFYIGDTTKISFSIAFTDLFSGKVYPFVQPLCGNEIGGFYSYLPIPYSDGCKIVFRGKTMRFLQIQYRELDEETFVKDFALDLSSEEKEALKKVTSIWNGKKITNLSKAKLEETKVLLSPLAKQEVFKIKSGGRIVGIEIDNANLFEGELNNIDIKITWDNEKVPAIYVPLADYFGYAFGKTSMQSIVMGTKNNINYCYLPMPFDKSASVELISRDSEKVYDFTTRVFYSSQKRDVKKEGKLYVEWNKILESQEGVPMTMISSNGKGHFIGAIMQTQNLKPGMTLFLEGDDIAIVDGENTIHGTGSEDYFNGGWYAFIDTWDRAMSLPVHGSLAYSLAYGRTGAYRWHLNDKISFKESLNYSMEHGPHGNKELVTNSTLGFYYCDSPKQKITEPTNELSKVYQPKTYMLYPQTMNLNLWIDVEMKTEWCSPSGGFTYIFKVIDESKIRVYIDEIPAGKYKLYVDYKELSEGCKISFWQRQNKVSKEINTYAKKKDRVEKLYVCDFEVSEIKNTLTLQFKTAEAKNKFLLNRLIFEKIE